jgi:hypothetical protein
MLRRWLMSTLVAFALSLTLIGQPASVTDAAA